MDVVPESDLAPGTEQRLDLNLNTLFRQSRLEELEALVESHRQPWCATLHGDRLG